MDDLALLPRTRVLLDQCDRPLKEIADGAGVGFEWLRKFKGPKSKRRERRPRHDWGVQKVQKLHDYLVSVNGKTA